MIVPTFVSFGASPDEPVEPDDAPEVPEDAPLLVPSLPPDVPSAPLDPLEPSPGAPLTTTDPAEQAASKMQHDAEATREADQGERTDPMRPDTGARRRSFPRVWTP